MAENIIETYYDVNIAGVTVAAPIKFIAIPCLQPDRGPSRSSACAFMSNINGKADSAGLSSVRVLTYASLE
jgi:hypothetical protein